MLDYFDAAMLKSEKPSTFINNSNSNSNPNTMGFFLQDCQTPFSPKDVRADARPLHCQQDHTLDNLKLNEVNHMGSINAETVEFDWFKPSPC